MGAAISANYGFRAVFLVTAGVVLFNAGLFMEQSTSSSNTPGIELIFRLSYLQSGESAILFPETSSTQRENRDDHVRNA